MKLLTIQFSYSISSIFCANILNMLFSDSIGLCFSPMSECKAHTHIAFKYIIKTDSTQRFEIH
jgi:hypothetical protein